MNPKVFSTRSSASLSVASTAFENGAAIPSAYTCDGKNISPPLKISGVPAAAKTLVLIVDDPDSPTGTWVHWVVFNIPDTGKPMQTFMEGLEPSGLGGRNSWGKTGYGGPCPGTGSHRYFFKIFAIDMLLTLPEGSTKEEVEVAMKGHILASGELTGRYERAR